MAEGKPQQRLVVGRGITLNTVLYSLEQLGDRQVVLPNLGAGGVEPADAFLRGHLLEHREHAWRRKRPRTGKTAKAGTQRQGKGK